MLVTKAHLMDAIDGGRYLYRAELPEYASGVYLYPWLVSVYFATTGEIYPIRVCTFEDIPLAIHCAIDLSSIPAITSIEITFDVPLGRRRFDTPPIGPMVPVEWKTVHAHLNGHVPD